MWYIEQSFGVVCKVPLRSSSHGGLCLFSPEELYWLWITCIQQDYISWLVLWSIQQFTSDWKWHVLAPARVFIVGIGHFDDSSNTDHLMKSSEHPFLKTIVNLTLDWCQSSDSWILVSLLPDLEVSDLKKSQSNQKSNGDNLSLCCLDLYHKCSEFLYSAFKDPDQYYDLWVYCMVWLDACLLSSGNDHRWHRASQQDMWLLWRKWLT